MKTVLFVPGFRETLASHNYQGVLEAIKGKGYKVKFVAIHWVKTTIEDWVEELDKEYSKYNSAETILAGFSFGAMTAFLAATKRNPIELWLFSFSPYFADDIPKMKKSWLNNIGRRRADAFRKLDFNTLAKNITCKTLIMVGEVEAKKYPLVEIRAQKARKAIAKNTCVIVHNCDHDVTDKTYIQAIKGAI